ncbi:MAG: cysteine--tRNA ligase [Tistrella sp.]|uniref:Cysteine--tRNA ligase n=2 Tax=Tistrella mobilis TaxID=171437 RepID=I3TMZ7_TISMK|nr:cysteine--tRNA ligase [Tistrella mobilis]AFK54135.1 Cysteinyl-tRNA synthetase [Tistrella mobilis KA081020-065]KYO49713.1 cysteine--tRNA ligase [Tistrella mobilis]MBA74825.1 cysteine--tRNA ligase [Tistrella sp.]HAE51585.1 cysteine--tRNA ligase [Tistrella mobilis]
MALSVYNTRTRAKEAFEPIDPDHIRMYVCGPTVYDRAHIGNARPVVVFDTLYRLLKASYPRVTYVRNITDVDDKIIVRAKESGEAIETLTARTALMFHEDMGELNALPPSIEPRATEHIPQMIDMIRRLMAKDHAYEAEGHVLFSVPSMPDYGGLSRRDREEMVAGARVEVAPYKRDAADFVLWKPSADDQPGWSSPWGRGRPGWHIECSAMAEAHLGETFDIHGGGQDLIFPHHENEIAQSQCAHDGALFVRYWMHNGFINVDGEKMSKSLGNFFTVRDLLGHVPGEAVRLLMLQTHYRRPLDWTQEGMERAKQTLDRFYNTLRLMDEIEPDGDCRVYPDAVRAALEDDLNTPLALMHLHELVGEANRTTDRAERARLKAQILGAGHALGLLRLDPEAWFRGGPASGGETGPDEAEIEHLINERLAARRNRDFATADRIRDDLKARGVVLEDGPDGTRWKRG